MSSKSKKKSKHRKLYKFKTRKRDALKWLSQNDLPSDLISSYSKRYGCTDSEAHIELMEIGYSDDLEIQQYEIEGTDWEYKFDGYSGEMEVVPKNKRH